MMIPINGLPNRELRKYVVCTSDNRQLYYFDDTDKLLVAERQLNDARECRFPRVIIDREDIENGEVNSNRV